MREVELVGDALNRLIEAKPRFDADDEQVERVGQPQPDPLLAALRETPEAHARQQIREGGRAKRHQDVRPDQHGRRDERKRQQR